MCKRYTSRAFTAPAPDHAALTLIGTAERPRVWSLAELRALPQSRLRLTMVCVANPFPARGWETVEWSGVPLAVLLRDAGAAPGAEAAHIAGLDGVLTELALSDLEGALLALDANGVPLSRAQGFPARLVIPAMSACAMPRFVQRLLIHNQPVKAVARTAPCAMITVAERVADLVRLEGMAFGDAVAVSCDGGAEVVTTVSGSGPGVAGTWSLDWPITGYATPRFQARPLVEQTTDIAHSERPLARHWKPALHQKGVTQ